MGTQPEQNVHSQIEVNVVELITNAGTRRHHTRVQTRAYPYTPVASPLQSLYNSSLIPD